MSAHKVFVGTFAHTPSLGELEIKRDHVLAVSSDGLVSHFAPAADAASIELVRGCAPADLTALDRHAFLVPTYSDLHIHGPQYLFAGKGLDLPLMEWLDRYTFKAETRIDGDGELAARVYERLGHRLLENGTSAALIFGTIKSESNLILARVFASLGLRTYVGKLSMDQNSLLDYIESSPEAALDAAAKFIDDVRAFAETLPEGQRNLVHPVITPRFVPTCSDSLLEGLGALAARTGVRVMSHMCEAQDQVDWVRSSRGKEDEDMFLRNGLLTAKTTQAHCTFLKPAMIELVKKQGTSIAHCPLSNAYFSSKTLPLRACLDAEIPVGLGSDIAGGYTVDLQVQMRQAVIASRLLESASLSPTAASGNALRVSWKEALFLATRGGALALAEPNVGGRFCVGEFFDAQLLELASPDGTGRGALDFFDRDADVGASAQSAEWWAEAVEQWWAVGDGRNRKGVWVQGRRVL